MNEMDEHVTPEDWLNEELNNINLECFIEQNREMDGEYEDVRGDEDARD